MAKQRVEVEVLAPEGECGRQHLQYRWPWPVRWECQREADFQYGVFREHVTASISDAECRQHFLRFFENYAHPSVGNIKRWANKVNYPRGSRTQSNAEILIYFALGCFILLALRTFVNG